MPEKFDYSNYRFPDRETREYARQAVSRIRKEQTKARPGPPLLKGRRSPNWPPLIVIERNGTVLESA